MPLGENNIQILFFKLSSMQECTSSF